MVRHLPIYSSDHAPILMSTDARPRQSNKMKRFHFEALWLASDECQGVIKNAWEGGGSASLPTRIAQCAEELSSWAEASFGGTKKRIREAEKELTMWQRGEPDAVMIQKCSELSEELDELHRKEETYWHARARANELRDGDKNTAYFHHKASSRRKRNQIVKLKNKEGELKCGEEELQKIIEAPGIDGMHALFFQKCWNIVGTTIVAFVQNWWEGTVDIAEINKTCIVLIPKCREPLQMGDFRPISLCNVVYKIISKVMANRLKVILPELISYHQSAFVPGRQITDNALVAFEIFHAMKRKGEGKRGTMALKLDMSKARV